MPSSSTKSTHTTLKSKTNTHQSFLQKFGNLGFLFFFLCVCVSFVRLMRFSREENGQREGFFAVCSACPGEGVRRGRTSCCAVDLRSWRWIVCLWWEESGMAAPTAIGLAPKNPQFRGQFHALSGEPEAPCCPVQAVQSPLGCGASPVPPDIQTQGVLSLLGPWGF